MTYNGKALEVGVSLDFVVLKSPGGSSFLSKELVKTSSNSRKVLLKVAKEIGSAE